MPALGRRHRNARVRCRQRDKYTAEQRGDHDTGISLGEMQATLLAKIEELTLHQIAQEKKLSALKHQNAALTSRLSKLEK